MTVIAPKSALFFVATGLALASQSAYGYIVEPPFRVKGVLSVNGRPWTSGTVSLRRERVPDPPEVLATSRLGSAPGAAGNYALLVPLDGLEPRSGGGARTGEIAHIYLDEHRAADVAIGDRGGVLALDVDLALPHGITLIRGPTASPAQAAAGDLVLLFAEAVDTLGHSLSYLWSADCPGSIDGSFDEPATMNPAWTAPQLSANTSQECVLRVVVRDLDGNAEEIQGSVVVNVKPVVTADPVPVIQASPAATYCNGEIAFDGSASFHGDPGNHVVSYDWDLSYDGVAFTADATGANVVSRYIGQAGDITVALRVTDASLPPRSTIATLVIHPGTLNRAPVADAGGPYTANPGQPLSLDGTASADPDAACGDAPQDYGWDLDQDSVFDDASGPSPVLPWAETVATVCGGRCTHGQAYPIGLQVRDMRDASGADGTTVLSSLLYFSDAFTDGSASGDPDWLVKSGSWTVKGAANKYYLSLSTAKPDTSLAQLVPPDLSSGRLEAKLALSEKFLVSPNGGLVFAYKDARHYRYVRLSRTAGIWKLVLGQVGAIGADLAGVKATRVLAGLRTGLWYPVWVDAYANGTVKVSFKTTTKPVITFKFKAAAPGKVGVTADRAQSKFDNFKAWEKGVLP